MLERTLILVDDNDDFRRSTAWWLEGEGYRVLEFGDGERAWQALEALPEGQRPLCLLLDVRMPGLSGPELHARLVQSGRSQAGAPWPVVYLTGHGDVPLAVEAMQRGAISFLEKPVQPPALLEALARAGEWSQNAVDVPDAVHGHDRPVNGAAIRKSGGGTPQLDDLELSERERQVLSGLTRGQTNKEIGKVLGISHKTVELHRGRLMGKFGARIYPELLCALVARGWTPGTPLDP